MTVEKLTDDDRREILGAVPAYGARIRAVHLIDQLTEALAAEEAAGKRLQRGAAEQIEFHLRASNEEYDRRVAAEARVRELEAEQKRLVRQSADNHTRANDTEQQLAAANALLRQVHADQAPTVSLLCAIGDHLSTQPAPPTDHDRAVLEAMGKIPAQNLRALLRGGQCALKGLPEAASAELARREAQR